MTEVVKLKAVIDPVRHARLLAGLDGFAQTAGIPPHAIKKNAREACNDKEIDWLKNYPQYKLNGEGLLMTAIHDPDPATKMQYMTAAFLRNFIDARLMSVNAVLDGLDKPSDIACEVILIPNLYQTSYGKTFPAHKVQVLYDYLLGRQAAGLVSVLYVQDLDALADEWGVLFAGHLKNYVQDKGKKA